MHIRRPTSRTSRRSLLAAAAAAVLAACGVSRGTPRAEGRHSGARATTTSAPSTTSTTVASGPARYVPNGPRTSTGVALTFHGSGDPGMTGLLLDGAHRLSAPITVFAVGTWLQSNPDIGHQIVRQGHTLANHTFTHPALATLSAAEVSQEIAQCAQVLDTIEGNDGRWFRPSGIDVPTALILTQAGLGGYPVSVGYDIDPLDYEDPGADVIVARVTQALQPGSIVSLHTGHLGTVEAFPGLVQLIRSRGLEPVLIGDLISL